MKNKEIKEMIQNRIEDIYQSGEYIYQAKELEEILSYIEQLEEEIAEYEFLIKTENEREYRSKFLKEFQKEHGKNVFPDYDEVYKRYDKLKEENKQLQKNREKAIKKLNKYRNRKDHYGLWCMNYGDNADVIHILKGDSDEQR